MHGRTRITKRSETRRLSYVDAFADEPWRPVDGSDMETLLTFEPVVHASNAAAPHALSHDQDRNRHTAFTEKTSATGSTLAFDQALNVNRSV